MTPLRILIVEDDEDLLSILETAYREVFQRHGYDPRVERAATVEEARRMAKAAKGNPYDFVSLDVNLGDQHLTGIDVLETLKRFRSAWMVALLTGVETDASLDKTVGKAKGDDLRKQLRRDAYARFPAERLLVVEKPSSSMARDEAETLLANRIEQIALVFEEVGRLRYVFRPIEVTSLERVPQPKGQKVRRTFVETTALHWQIRFDCGEIRSLPNLSGFKTLHYLLSRDRSVSVTPEEALAIEPKTDKSSIKAAEPTEDPVATYFESQGIAWKELGQADQEKLMRAALSLKFNRYRELRGFQDEEDISTSEESELNRIIRELGPLADAAETAYQRMKPAERISERDEATPGILAQNDLHAAAGNYAQLGADRKGKDSPAAQLFRARMKRVKDCLRENGFADLAQHLEDYVMSTGANWSYNPPDGVEWTT